MNDTQTKEENKEIKQDAIDYKSLMQKYLIQGSMPNTSNLIGMNEYKIHVLKEK